MYKIDHLCSLMKPLRRLSWFNHKVQTKTLYCVYLRAKLCTFIVAYPHRRSSLARLALFQATVIDYVTTFVSALENTRALILYFRWAEIKWNCRVTLSYLIRPSRGGGFSFFVMKITSFIYFIGYAKTQFKKKTLLQYTTVSDVSLLGHGLWEHFKEKERQKIKVYLAIRKNKLYMIWHLEIVFNKKAM